METNRAKALLLLTLSSLFDIDPTGKDGVPTSPLYLALQSHNLGTRDWSALVSMLTAGDEPLCRQKGHTLYLTAVGRALGGKVSGALAGKKAA